MNLISDEDWNAIFGEEMRVLVLSDLHIEADAMNGLTPPRSDKAYSDVNHPELGPDLSEALGNIDVVVLAGDVGVGATQVSDYLISVHKYLSVPVVYVAGNHEFYRMSQWARPVAMADVVAKIKSNVEDLEIYVLDNQDILINGFRFVGSTLWTDFKLYGDDKEMEAKVFAQQRMTDFSETFGIRIRETITLTAELTRKFNVKNQRYLKETILKSKEPVIVVTHHAPFKGSLHPQFENDMLSAAFVSDIPWIDEVDNVPLWLHGHTHHSFDYTVRNTKVVCNPHGYRAGDNPDFCLKVVEL